MDTYRQASEGSGKGYDCAYLHVQESSKRYTITLHPLKRPRRISDLRSKHWHKRRCNIIVETLASVYVEQSSLDSRVIVGPARPVYREGAQTMGGTHCDSEQ